MKETRELTHAEAGIPMLSQKYIISKVQNRSKMYTSIAELKVHNESSEHGPEVQVGIDVQVSHIEKLINNAENGCLTTKITEYLGTKS